ncbi:MAG TPA: hypothetical protein VK915_03595 [Gaiellaceae bacterium]|nr:hypothetical protein [Gaiellaceae bacterium]
MTEERERYSRYRVFIGTTRAEGAVRMHRASSEEERAAARAAFDQEPV